MLTDSSLHRARPRSPPKPKSTAETSSPSPRHRSRYSPRHFVCLFIKIAVNLWSGPCVALYIFPSVRSADGQANSHAWLSPALSVQLIIQEQKRPWAEDNREPSMRPKAKWNLLEIAALRFLSPCAPFTLLIILISAWNPYTVTGWGSIGHMEQWKSAKIQKMLLNSRSSFTAVKSCWSHVGWKYYSIAL